jgi:hypothetical protein
MVKCFPGNLPAIQVSHRAAHRFWRGIIGGENDGRWIPFPAAIIPERKTTCPYKRLFSWHPMPVARKARGTPE